MKELATGLKVGPWTIDHVVSYGDPAYAVAHNGSTEATLLLRPSDARSKRLAEREVIALDALAGSHVPRLLDRGDDGERSFLALQRLFGDTLSDRLVGGQIEWQQATVWLYELAVALRHVHSRGWAHRAVNPASLVVGPRHQAWLVGLEHASPLGEPSLPGDLSAAALAYAAPEVLRDPSCDLVRADLYAFGLVAYEVLSGDTAFPAAAWAERPNRQRALMEWKTRTQELDPGPDQPDWLRALVRKCTRPEPASRLPDMDAVVAWLEGSRSTWELPDVQKTPVALPRGGLPPLHLEPALLEIRVLREAQERQNTVNRALMLFSAASIGMVAGLLLSAIVIMASELAKLG